MEHQVTYTRENVADLAVKLRNLRASNPKAITFKDLLIRSGIVDGKNENGVISTQQRFSRWLNSAEVSNQWKLLKEPEFQKLTTYLSGNPLLSASSTDSNDITSMATAAIADVAKASVAVAFIRAGKLLGGVAEHLPNEGFRSELEALVRKYDARPNGVG